MFKKIFIVASIVLLIFIIGNIKGYSDYSKPTTLVSKEQDLAKQQVEYLKRIAIALEDIKWELRRIRK